MRKRLTATDREISRLLHNVRNKLYRLRKKGASEDDLAKIDPRNTARGVARREGTLTTGAGKLAYIRQLKEFVSRENNYQVANNGDILSGADVKRYREAEARANAAKKPVRARMLRVGGADPVYHDTSVGDIKISDLSEIEQRASFFKTFSPVKRSTPFGSRLGLKGAIKAQETAYANAKNYEKRLVNYRASIINRLYENGDIELMQRFKALSNDQFEYLTLYTDLNELSLTLDYVSEVVDDARTFNDDIQTQTLSGLRRVLEFTPERTGKNSLRSMSHKNYLTKSERRYI